MIKIIENGNTHQRKRCEVCGCVFEFDKVDIKLYPTEYNYKLNCPECGAVIVVEFHSVK